MMLRMLTLLGTVGAAWALSQYLPSENLAKDSERTAAIVTRALPVAGAKPADQRSVALLDLAVAALPAGAPEIRAAEFQPAASGSAPLPVEVVPASASELISAAAAPDTSEPEAVPAADPKLTRLIQRELRRVGCLKSAADGVWGRGTERAMRRFAERIEADLPVDGPDSVLLILFEKFEDRACGASCPAGDIPNAHGRCQPAAQTAGIGNATTPLAPANVAALSGDDSPALSEPLVEDAAESAGMAPLASPADTPAGAAKAKPRRANAKTIRTSIARVAKPKRARVARLAQPRRKTRWALPRAYGLGVDDAKPARAAGASQKKRRLGAAAAFRRWMRRTNTTMR